MGYFALWSSWCAETGYGLAPIVMACTGKGY